MKCSVQFVFGIVRNSGGKLIYYLVYDLVKLRVMSPP